MGSDRDTVTASSTERPSWRNRHLNQLSAEQLGEVKQHRGDSVSVTEMAGVEESPVRVTAEGAANALPAMPPEVGAQAPRQAPVQQAGPEQRPDYMANPAQMPFHQDRPRSQREALSYDEYHQQRYIEERQHQADSRRDSRGEAARFQTEPSRYDRSHDDRAQRHHYRDEQRSRYASDQAGSAGETVHLAEKKSFLTRLVNFRLPLPVKVGLMGLAIALMVAVSLLKPIDHSSQSQLDSAFTRAMIGFGLAKTLNGVISVAQGTEFAVQPAGVGVNFSPGEILDPINDLVERFSLVMLIATSSIGIQKILLEVSSWAGISVLLGGAGVFFLLTRLRNSAIARWADIAGKLLFAMLLVRFLIPVGSLANDWVYYQFLQPQYEESSAELEVASERIREISARQTEVPDEEGSIADRAKRLYSSVTSKFDFDGMLDDYKQSAETVSESAINLIVVFVLQTIIFPLLFMYLIFRLFRFAIFSSKRTS